MEEKMRMKVSKRRWKDGCKEDERKKKKTKENRKKRS